MKISTHTIRHLSQAVALVLIAAGLAVPVGVAAGKQPSDAFERAVARGQAAALPDVIERYAASHPYGSALSTDAAPTGEAKNETPFTQIVTAPASSSAGEAKNQLPFTAPAEAQAQTIVVRTSSGFSWGDAAIGAFGALGIAFALTGIAMYARTTRPHHSPAL
jgi:hypothetical protein